MTDAPSLPRVGTWHPSGAGAPAQERRVLRFQRLGRSVGRRGRVQRGSCSWRRWRPATCGHPRFESPRFAGGSERSVIPTAGGAAYVGGSTSTGRGAIAGNRPSPQIAPMSYCGRGSARCSGPYSLRPLRRTAVRLQRSLSPCAPLQRRLRALATNLGEICGLGLFERTLRLSPSGVFPRDRLVQNDAEAGAVRHGDRAVLEAFRGPNQVGRARPLRPTASRGSRSWAGRRRAGRRRRWRRGRSGCEATRRCGRVRRRRRSSGLRGARRSA